MSRRRRLAQALARHALAVTPPERRAWAQGMAAELAHIDDDGAALSFASGAVWTGYRQGARLWSNWLRLGRWGAALATAMLGLGLFHMSGWLPRLPDAYKSAVPFGVLAGLLGCGYLAAAWGLATRKFRVVVGMVAGASTLLTATALRFGAEVGAASPLSAYASMLRREPPPPEAFYAALLLEEYVFLAVLAITGAFFWRAERSAAARLHA